MLKVEDIHAYYGKSHVLQGVNLFVPDGEAVALLGRNGVGKSTTLKTIMGLIHPRRGSINFNDVRTDQIAPHKVASLGLGYVPQGRRIFPNLSVYENLCVGLAHQPSKEDLEYIFGHFPILKERMRQKGGTLSGGELQILAIARCLIMKPKTLLLDEPTEGIMPVLVSMFRDEIIKINKGGVSVLLVEQNLRMVLAVCGSLYIMEKGVICYQGTPKEIRKSPEVVNRFLGVDL